jgi:hypothetical protein
MIFFIAPSFRKLLNSRLFLTDLKMVIARGLPSAEGKPEVWIHPLIAGG